MKTLITGGAGFIGCNFVRHMLAEHPDEDIVVLDKLTYADRLENLEEVMDRVIFIKDDSCDKEIVESMESPDFRAAVLAAGVDWILDRIRERQTLSYASKSDADSALAFAWILLQKRQT